MPDPLDWLDDALADLDARGLRRTLSVRQSRRAGGRIEIDGRSLVDFGSNDYLGLASDPLVSTAVQAELDRHGWGSGASPLVTGRSLLHAELERQLAIFEGTEAAILFSAGYAANVGTIAAVVEKGDAIYSDELNHATIIDGCRLSGAAIRIYRHGDVAHLGELLKAESSFRRRLIVTDSLFSMGGDFAPLKELASLAGDFRAMLMVDEAHATGVFGKLGRGLCEEFGIEKQVSIRVGTLSKALGGLGGFVAGSQRLIDWLANRARSYGFSTAAPAVVATAGLAALEIVRAEPMRRQRLLEMAASMRQRLAACGLDCSSSQCQIIPVILGDAGRTVAASAELRGCGYFVPAIRPPSVPEGQSMLRISVTALHSEEHIAGLVAALGEVAR